MEKPEPIKTDPETDFEVSFYEGILKYAGDFIQALSVLGDIYTRQGLHEKGLEIDKKLARLRSDDPVVLYNLACSYSLVNQIDKAFETMKLAIECGYDDFPFLEQDRDLKNLLSDSRFQGFFSRVKSKEGHPKEQKKKSS
jgi:hypothetical protein